MTEQRTRPPVSSNRIPYRIQRVPPGKALAFWVLSDSPCVVGTHWTGSRSVRCPETDKCPYCLSGKETRWRGYVFGKCLKSGQVSIVEYPGGVGNEVADFGEQQGTLRGAQMILRRRGKNINSPVDVSFSEVIQRADQLPEIPDLFSLICRIYEVRSREALEDAQESSTVKMRRRHA